MGGGAAIHGTVKHRPVSKGSVIVHLHFVGRLGLRALTHHEHWDGKGYPDGLSGEQIPQGTRVLSVADAYDAMTSERPYRKAMNRDEARAEITRFAGSQFDPGIVNAFLEISAANPAMARVPGA